MSSQRGNVSRTRKQKHQNSKAFKNDMHDKSDKIKLINSVSPEGLCQRCKEIIEWKIRYKKYKPLKQAATCVRCHCKTVKRAYYTVCQSCATEAQVCAKCNSKKSIVLQPTLSDQEKQAQDGELQFEMNQLTERQRRSVLRHLDKGVDVKLPEGAAAIESNNCSDDSTNEDSGSDEEEENEAMDNYCDGIS